MQRSFLVAVTSLLLSCGPPSAALFISNRMGLRETNVGQSASDCSQVEAECKDKWTGGAPVCASNGVTYNNLCLLREVICRDSDVQFKHEGECRASERCLLQRAAALQDLERHKYGVYVPDCEENGSFQPMQCHPNTGYCWCVTPAGQTTGVSANGDGINDLNCSKNQGGRREDFSRNKPQELPCSPYSKLARCSSKEGCSLSRKLIFVSNMVNFFTQEFQRQPSALDISEESQKTAAVNWKFRQMDDNGDELLGRKEYKNLRRLLRRSRDIEPQSCAKEFPLLCDTDNNKKISRQEWTACWRSQKPTQRSGLRQKRKKGEKKKNKKKQKPKKDKKQKKERKAYCSKERESELSKAKTSSGRNQPFVPVCDRRGRYRPYQCYGALDRWYCWCVSVVTGYQLPDTSVRTSVNSSINCNKMNLPTKPWTRCRPADDKRIFLDALVQYFNETLGSEASSTKQDLVLRMFHKLDINQDNKLTRKEMKKLHRRIKSSKVLKKCGRHIHKVCDANDDRALYANEWQNCLLGKGHNSKRGSDSVRGPVTSNSLSGGESKSPWVDTNPFVDVLVSEDAE